MDNKGRKTRMTGTENRVFNSRLCLRIREEQHQKLELISKERNIPITELVRAAIFAFTSQFDEEDYNDMKDAQSVYEPLPTLIEESEENRYMNDVLVYKKTKRDVYEYSSDEEYINEMFNDLMV
jgi:hypothetical protein